MADSTEQAHECGKFADTHFPVDAQVHAADKDGHRAKLVYVSGEPLGVRLIETRLAMAFVKLVICRKRNIGAKMLLRFEKSVQKRWHGSPLTGFLEVLGHLVTKSISID